MALDTKLTQNINLRANGDQLLGPMKAFGREIDAVIKKLSGLADGMSKGGHKSEDSLRAQVQLLQRLIGEASTLQNILTSAGNRKRDNLFAGLDEQSIGKRAASASKLKRELDTTKSAADALDVRLAQLYKRFGDLAQAGRKVGERDLAKAYNTENAIKQVRRLELELQRLDSRAASAGKPPSGEAAAMRAEIAKAQGTLLARIKSPTRVNWGTEIAGVEALIGKYRQLTVAETEAGIAAERAQAKTRASVLANVNQSDAMLRASIERGASRFKYTPDQARQFNMPALGRQIDDNVSKLGRLRDMMSKAVEQNRGQGVLDRLSKSWQSLTGNMSEAIAKQRAFNDLPEQKGARARAAVSEAMFGDGGMAFGKRMLGAAALGTVAFGAINAVQGSAKYVVELEDALKGLQAIAGATDIEMRELSQSILDTATGTKFSTIEITKAATAIAQAGFSAQETSTVLKDALTLATASGSTPNEAVDTLTSALGAFQLQASESTHVVDVMVAGLNRSKLSINQMQSAIQYAGATAHESGVSFEELTAIAGSLAQAGIRSGSTIGTGLRQMLVDLKNPTEDFKKELTDLGLTMADVDVESKGLANVVKTLSDAGFSAGAAYNSMEVRAASAFLALKGQLDFYNELTLAQTQSGAAAEAQARAMDSLSAKWQQFLNIAGGGAAVFGEPFVNALKGALDILNGFGTGIRAISGLFGEAEGPVAKFFSTISSGLAVAGAGFLVAGPWGAVIGGVLGLVGALNSADDALEAVQATASKATQEFDSQKQTIASVDEAINRLVTRETTLRQEKAALSAETLTLTQKFVGLSAELGNAASNYDNLLAAMLRYRGAELQKAAVSAQATALAKQDEQRGLVGKLEENQIASEGYATAAMGVGAGQRNRGVINQGLAASRQQFDVNGSSEQSMRGEIAIQTALNNLHPLKNDPLVAKLIESLTERLNTWRQLAGTQASIRGAGQIMNVYREQASPQGAAREKTVLDGQRAVNTGLDANKRKPGSGDGQLTGTRARLSSQIGVFNDQMSAAQRAGNKALVTALKTTIDQLEEQVGRIDRERRVAKEAADKSGRGDKDAPKGSTLPAAEVAKRLQAQFPGIGVSFARERKPGDYGYKPSSYHAQPGGQAIDIASLPKGVSWDNVASAIEGMGLSIKEAPNTTTGLKDAHKLPLNHGSGPHGHFAWGAKESQFSKDADTAATKEETDLQKLQKQRATYAVAEQQKRIQAIINEAKAGTGNVADMSKEIDGAIEAYRNAKLAEFDTANPTEGLSEAMMTARKEARDQLVETLREDARNFHAQYVRQIIDSAQSLLDAAFDASSKELQRNQFENGARVRTADGLIDAANNNVNRGRIGAGTMHFLERSKNNAEIERDRLDIGAMDADIARKQGALEVRKAAVSPGEPGSEADVQNRKQIAAAEQEITTAIQNRATAQMALTARTAEFANIPLGDRLRESVAAWGENSGAMENWSTTLENSIGPALDMFTNQLAAMFQAISDGSFTVKQAFEDFTSAFTKMVMQIITKALALMAVKAILGAFGLQLQNSDGGTVISKKQMTGGPAGEPRKFMQGGSPDPYISQGISNRDTVPALLARKEYVVRGSSVDSLGLPFMDAINRHGAKAFDKMKAAPPVVGNNARQETNVYVVKPDEQPQLGPNDIKLVIADDILQGGQTKQLIKRVIQGG